MKLSNSGFTLIELMIVIAIIGILASIAIPAYQDYVAKTQIIEAVEMTAGMKTGVLEYFQNKGGIPSVADVTNVTSGKFVDSITIISSSTNAIIIRATMKTVDISPNIQGRFFAMATPDGGRTWECGTSGALSSTVTTVSPIYLPTACK